MFDYIVIGAGFAGSVIAERIANKLNKKVLVIEQRDHIAGNCFDFKDENNILIHKYGPHLFHTDDKNVMDYLSNFSRWEVYNHKVLAYIDGKEVPIPFNFNTIYDLFPQKLAARLETKLLNSFKYNSKIPILELKNLKDEDMNFLAEFIYEKVFLNYTAKQWNMKPEELENSVTARVPVSISRDDRYFYDKYQVVPSDGYTKLFEKMLKHKNITLMLNTDFKEVCSIVDNKFNFKDKVFIGKVIYTGQLDELFENRFGDLEYRSVDMQFETVKKEYYQQSTTINYPNNYDFTRITEFKHIHFTKTDKTTILKEYPQNYIKGKNIPYYPIFDNKNKEKYNKYFAYSKNIENLILLGRLAEYKYYDMDDIVKRALDVFKMDIENV
jgi:UDP-galactopyranose mutase